MKLRNKKTGEIPEKIETIAYIQWSKMIMMVYINNDGERIVKQYDSLETFNEEWEDYEEPKKYWFVNSCGVVEVRTEDKQLAVADMHKQFGNYFETKEEAELALRKLRAWKRLKDKGLHVTTFYVEDGSLVIRAKTHNSSGAENWEDLDLLFGGEE